MKTSEQHTPNISTILLVEDDVFISTVTSALLEDIGYIVVEANSGEAALASLKDGLRPDLIVTDYAMPGMTGTQLAVAVRTLAPTIPILLATGFDDVRKADIDGLSRITKPYTQYELNHAINLLLSPS